MAYSTDSLTFKLTFTDGTFMTLYNLGSDVGQIPEGEHTFILPNFMLGNFTGRTYSFTKYDSDGNKYVISNKGVIINDTIDFTSDNRCIVLGYNPDDKTISVYAKYPDPTTIPDISTSDRAVTGMAYNSDVTGSGYDSFGAALARGEKFYNDLSYGWYNITNVIPNVPFFSVNHFHGGRGTSSFINNVPNSGGGSSWSANLDLDDVVEDFNPEEPIITDTDPYNDEDEITMPGGGGGNHDLDSDDIDIPNLPGLSAVDTGFITLFNPSLSELQALSDYLWSPLFDIDTVKKLFADPMDVFLGLSIVPVQVPNGSSKTVKVAGISTGVTMTLAARQYVEVDCGSINVREFWGAYLDYDPYTKVELYLPYVGTHPIAVDDIMGKTITIKYHVDILSGACVAYVKCGSSVLYSFIGQCSSSIPINRSDWTSVINGALTIATAIGTMVATGGASAPMSSGSAAEAGAATGTTAAKEASKKAAMIHGASNIASTAVNVMKPSIEKSGSISGTGGMMAVQKPYLIITRPKQAVPSNQKHYMGYPSFITTYLSSLNGYTEMEYIHLEGISATDEELAEIESLLKGGVYL